MLVQGEEMKAVACRTFAYALAFGAVCCKDQWNKSDFFQLDSMASGSETIDVWALILGTAGFPHNYGITAELHLPVQVYQREQLLCENKAKDKLMLEL